MSALAEWATAEETPAKPAPSTNASRRAKASTPSAPLPLLFIENVGQFDPQARFQVRGGNGVLWLAEDGIWITALEKQQPPDPANREPGPDENAEVRRQAQPRRGVHLKLSFVGANPNPRIEPLDRLPTRVSYFRGNDPAKWHANVPVWSGVRYVDLYPGVDLELHGASGGWRARIVTRAGANADAVRLKIEGAGRIRVDGERIRLTTAVGDLALPRFGSATVDGASALSLPGFEDLATTVRNALAPRDALAASVDDPADLLYSTLLGGSSFWDRAYDIAVDGSGAAYVTGYTYSTNFPTTVGAFDTSYNGDGDTFVTKLDASGSALIYSTFLSGSGYDEGVGITVDGDGAVYVTGNTSSGDFPTTNGAFDTTVDTTNGDAFVTKIGATGTTLVYSTALGGSAYDQSNGIAVDGNGTAYIAGRTKSTNFPTTAGAFDTSHNGNYDVFVTKLSTTGSTLVYSTFIGTSGNEVSTAIAVDSSGAAHVTGSPSSSSFPTTAGAFDRTHNGSGEVFVTKLNATGSNLVYSTFLGGSNSDQSYSIAVDNSGAAFVTGRTYSTNFPTTTGAFDASFNGLSDVFVTKFDAAGSTLVYSTLLGGNDHEVGWAIVVDGSGAAYITGHADSANFPTTPGAFDTSHNGEYDVFATKLNATGSGLAYSTFIGGSAYQDGYAIAVDSNGPVYLTGYTASADFPITNGAFDTIYNDTDEVFVAKINPDPSFASVPDPLEFIEKPSRGQVGFGVDTGSGMYMYRWTDLGIPGRGPSPVFARAYNSADLEVGPLGPSWTHSYNSRIVQDASGAAIVVAPNGRRDVYTPQGSGTFTPPPEITSVLTQDTATGIYTLVHQDQSVWTYNAQGKLTSIKDRFGNESTLSYDTSGRLTSISDPAGRGSLTLAYDTCFAGRLCSVSDWLSPARTVQYAYDSEGRLWKVTDREGKVTTFGYDGPSHRLTTITDANSRVAIAIDYDTQGRVTEQKDARGIATDEKTTFTYTANPDGTTTTTVLYPTTSFEPSYRPVETHTYDTQGRLVERVIKPTSNSNDDVETQYAYDASGFITAITDGRGNTTNFCYDVNYAGSAVAGSRGNLTRRIDPPPSLGANRPVTLYQYDAKNNVIQAIPPKGVASGTTVDCATNLSASVNLTYATDFTYDAATQTKLESATRTSVDPDTGSPVSAVTKYEFNDSSNPGLVTKIIPPRGNTGGTPDYTYATSFTYFTTGSKAGLLESVTDPLGNKTTYDYDAVGRVTTMVDPLGNALGGSPADHTWEYSYDNEDRLRFAKAPAPAAGGSQLVTEFRYDAVGNRTVVIDANGQVTKYVYDERDSLKEVWESPNPWTDPAVEPSPKFVTAYSYDHLGNLSRVTRAKDDSTYERAVDYVYDGLSRLRTETQYPSWPTTTPTLVTQYAYDENSNLKTRTDPEPGPGGTPLTTTFGYDALNRLTSIDYSEAGTSDVSYQYDANGNRTQMVDGIGTTSYTYDELDRLLPVTSPGPKTVGYRYDLDGNRTKVKHPDSTPSSDEVTYTFDKASRLVSLLDWANRTTSYEYFADGSLKRITNPNGTIADYTYDNARRLTDVWNQQSTNTISRHTYAVDAVGNRTQVDELLPVVGPPGTTTARQTTYDYDHLYRLTSATVPSGPTTYTYDPVGNRLSMTRGGNTTSYDYDRADRITTAGAVSYSVNANGNVVARGADSFAYDQANRLKSATIEGVTSTYTYDGDGKRTSKAVGGTTTSYVYDVNASLPVVLDDGARKYVYGLGLAYAVTTSGAIEVYHTDGLGSVRAITDAAGNVTQTYLSDEFGNLQQTGSTSTQPFQFAGQQRDAETSLYYLRARMYDPAAGRFLSRDPLAGVAFAPQTLNRYAYVGNNPATFTDPSGQIAPVAVLAFAWAAFEIGSAAYDAVTTAQTLADPSVSAEEKAVVGGLFVAGLVAPGGGYATVLRRARSFQWGNLPPKVLGVTDKFGNITIQRGLSGRLFDETLRHETVHSILSPRWEPIADAKMWIYQHSDLWRYLEEAVAEGYATRSAVGGLKFPLTHGYVSGKRLVAEGAAVVGGVIGALELLGQDK